MVIEIVKEQIDYTEKIKKSWIVTGFPRTKVQALALQKMCVIPDKIIHIKSIKNTGDLNDADQKITAEHELNLNAVISTFNNFIFEYDTCDNTFEQTCSDLARMTKLRFRDNAPRRPPRVILLGPPGSGRTTTTEMISKRFGLVNVSPLKLLQAEAKRNPAIKIKIQQA